MLFSARLREQSSPDVYTVLLEATFLLHMRTRVIMVDHEEQNTFFRRPNLFPQREWLIPYQSYVPLCLSLLRPEYLEIDSRKPEINFFSEHVFRLLVISSLFNDSWKLDMVAVYNSRNARSFDLAKGIPSLLSQSPKNCYYCRDNNTACMAFSFICWCMYLVQQTSPFHLCHSMRGTVLNAGYKCVTLSTCI